MIDILVETGEKLASTRGTGILRDEQGRLLPKQESLNPSGRPAGSYSLKTKIIQLLKDKPEVEKQLIADLLEKEQGLLIQMIDGRPKQDVEVAHKEAPQPIINLGNLTKTDDNVVIQSTEASALLKSP
jgi:hypothetical protein